MRWLLIIGALLSGLASGISAEPVVFESGEQRVTLVELFTSEGCSSCPPAEAWLGRLRNNPGLWKNFVPVAFHVDYWDRLGWPDRFASRAFTERQHRYATAWNSPSVYTPCFVVNGSEWRDWSTHDAPPAVSKGVAGTLRVTLRDATNVEISYTPAKQLKQLVEPLRATVALLGSGIESDVKRGENSGRKLRHDFVVLHFTDAALKEAGGHYTANISLPEKLTPAPSALAAWVASTDALMPIQVTGGWITTH
jgi:hypothetical protein